MSRPAFTLLETLLVAGIIAVAGALVVPAYHEYQERNNLNLAMEHVAQAVNRARQLAKNGREDAPWGYSVTEEILYKGANYTQRDPGFDEEYAIDDAIEKTGLSEVSFSRLEGAPSATGTITLTLDEYSTSLTIDDTGIIIVSPDEIVICHSGPGGSGPKNLKVDEHAWPAHEKHGDKLGPCGDE